MDNADSTVECNRKALEYLQSVDFKSIGRTVFQDNLATVSEAGKSIGELTISVSETIVNEEICYYIHAQSHGVIDEIPMGTSVTAYVSRNMVTLEQTQHEYIKFPNKPLDKKTILLREDDLFRVRRITMEGTSVKESEKTYPLDRVKGFISEGANIILQRVMCQRQDVPESSRFLALDSSNCLKTMKYEKLPDCTSTIDENVVPLFGIHREIFSKDGSNLIWQTHFITDGHMASRVTVGSPVRMQLIKLPQSDEQKIKEEKIDSVRHDLHWEEDMQMQSNYIERKEELINDHKTYLRHKPELRALLEDFCQFVLLRKPEDVCSFASEYFASFSTKMKPPNVVRHQDQ